ncbi:uncharacterized mitochondrial protein AtMg00310-like [Tripterygium wilfordii]|uniref:uncharacterized mitochondrial protein AtMg00310-like n=1 Tax=Tripterygium wilfordii TaxID=458696 RepID=UPI0018F83148|nr:uncharacterized mitochondrial protein AtMg00310-like [Tripterygium wilfordii]
MHVQVNKICSSSLNMQFTLISQHKFPNQLCQEIDQVLRSFWWGGLSGERHRIVWVSWEKNCRAKKEGGLGFMSFSSFNEALLLKQSWRNLKNPNSLVGHVMKLKYFNNMSLRTAPPKASDVFAWKSILSARALFQSGLLWIIGDGRL